jgi:transcriptional regulator with XRE-family HTH domain
MGSRKTTNIDKHIAARLKAARKEAGLSQTEAGEDVLGVSFQQLQKIETGANRISAGNLYKLAFAYGKSVAWFYEGIESPTSFNGDLSTQLLGAYHGVDLARDYLAIQSEEHRKAVVDLAATLAVRS